MNEECIEKLNELLGMVMQNDVVGLAVVTVHANGSMGTSWTDEMKKDVFKALGAMEHLKQRYYFQSVELPDGE